MSDVNLLQLSGQETAQWLLMQSVSVEGQMMPEIYYRQFGLRRAVQLVAPTLRPINQLQMPRNAILHHWPSDETLYGIEPDDPLVALEKRLIPVAHVMTLTSHVGPPRPMPVPAMRLVRDYHKKYRRTRRIINLSSVLKDPVTPVVVNYGLLPHLFRYTKTFMAGYNKWLNIQVTQLDTVKHYLKTTRRDQYIPCNLPTRLPSVQLLNRASQNLTRSLMTSFFNEPSSLVLLDLWKWLGEERATSMFDKFDENELKRINLFFVESGQWFVINLGLLNSWRQTDDNPKGMIRPQQMQRRFLRLMMYLFETRTVGDDSMPITAPSEPKNDIEYVPDKSGKVDPKTTEPEIKPTDIVKPTPTKIKVETDSGQRTMTLRSGMNIDVLPEDHHIEETQANIEIIDAAITKDLEALDQMMPEIDESQTDEGPEIVESEKPMAADAEIKIEYRPKEQTLESGIMDPAMQLAKQGLLSAAELRRMQALSTAYQKLPNPYQAGESNDTLAKASVVTAESLKIRSDIKVPDSSTIMDKSMLKSSLTDFTPRYVREIMKKDVLRSVLAVQHAGVAVTGYRVDEAEDAMGAFEMHSVQFTPVRGKPSTLQFKIPKVSDDGTYRSNGVRYRLRSQRRD